MRFHVPRQAGELADLAVVGLAQLRGRTEPSVSLVSNSRSDSRTVLLSRKAAGSDAISPETSTWPTGNPATTGSTGSSSTSAVRIVGPLSVVPDSPRSGSLPQGSRDPADGVIVQTGLSDASLAAPAGEGWRQRGRNEGTSLRQDAGYDEKC